MENCFLPHPKVSRCQIFLGKNVQRGTFCVVRYDEVIQGDAVTFQYIQEVEKISKFVHGVKRNKILATIPYSKELQLERAMFPCKP
jgi:hypothetical protein